MSEETSEQETQPTAPVDLQTAARRAIELVDQIRAEGDVLEEHAKHFRHQLMLELKRLGGRNPGPHIGAMEKTAAEVDAIGARIAQARAEMLALGRQAFEFALAAFDRSNLEAIGPIPAGDVVVKDPAGRMGVIVSVNNADGTVLIGYPDGTTAVHLQEEVKDTNGQPFNFNADPHE